MPSVRSVLTNLQLIPTHDGIVPWACVSVRINAAALFGFTVETTTGEGDVPVITNLEFVARAPSIPSVTQTKTTKRKEEPYIDVHYLLHAAEFWLLVFLLDDRSAAQLRDRATDRDFVALTRTLGERFRPGFAEDGQDLYWFADGVGVANVYEWLCAQHALIDRVNDGIVCATDGNRSLLTDEGSLTASAELVLQAIVVRIRSRTSLIGRLLIALTDESADESAPPSSVRSRAPASESVAA